MKNIQSAAYLRNYDEAVKYLLETGEMKKLKHSLDDLIGILRLFSSPQERLNVIHIAGTNGKGSSCAMLSAVLTEAGYKVGVFTSPHLLRFNERLVIDGEAVGDGEFAGLLNRVLAAADEYFGATGLDGQLPYVRLSFFETLTLMAFVYFYERGVDYAVIETGIGGRLDASNIVTKPRLCVITRIGYDHMNILGDSIESIAAEKAGIIKKNCPAVLYLNDNKVYNVIRDVAGGLNAPFYYDGDVKCEVVEADISGTVFSAESEYFAYEGLRLGLFGGYQIENACGVLLAVRALNDLGVCLEAPVVYAAFEKVRWPCRAEIVNTEPLILIDGAHNIDGASALDETLKFFEGKRIILTLGFSKDKPYKEILALLSKRAETVILTKPDCARAAGFDDFDTADTNIIFIDDYREAVDTALRIASDDCVICFAGSLYLAGCVRGYLMDVRKEHYYAGL